MKNYDKELLKEITKNSTSFSEILKKLNLSPQGANYKMIKNLIINFNIDHKHLLCKNRRTWKTGIKKSWDEILIENYQFVIGSSIKQRLIKENILKYECYICSISSWNNNKLTLQLDHINGINNDNRIENLRLLCPNCHSQTTTFAGRKLKNKKQKPPIVKCLCGNLKHFHSKFCKSCFKDYQHKHLTKIKWPNNDVLKNMVNNFGFLETGKRLGVSDNAVRKRLKYNAFSEN